MRNNKLRMTIIVFLVAIVFLSVSFQILPATYAVNKEEPFYSFDYIIPSYLTDVSGYKTYEQLYQLAEVIGPRRMGTDQCLPAASYVAEQFKSFGLKAEWHNFTFSTREATCRIVAPEGLKRDILDASPDTLSPDTTGIQARVTYVYFTNATTEFEAVKDIIPGTIAFIEIPYKLYTTTFRRYATVEAAKYGAVATFVYSYDADFWGIDCGAYTSEIQSSESSPQLLPIPCIALSYGRGYPSEDAKFLKTHWSEVTLFISVMPCALTGYNIIGILKGALEPQKYIILCGHYDTRGMRITGANDDTSGSATVLELARVLSKFHPNVTIKFIVWDGEERGLLGSRAYVEEHMDDIERERILAVFAFDWSSAGYPTYPIDILTRPVAPPRATLHYRNWDNFTDEQKARFNEFVAHTESVAYDELEFPEGIYVPGHVGVRDDTHYWSDHAPFTTLAVPGWQLTGADPADYPFYHTPGDNLDTLIDFMGGLDKLAIGLRVSGLIAGTLALEISKVRPSDAISAVGEYFGKAEKCLTLSGRNAIKEVTEAYKAGEDYEAVAESWITILREMTRRFVKALELALNIVKPEETHALAKNVDAKTKQLKDKELLIETQIQKLLESLSESSLSLSLPSVGIPVMATLPATVLQKKND